VQVHTGPRHSGGRNRQQQHLFMALRLRVVVSGSAAVLPVSSCRRIVHVSAKAAIAVREVLEVPG
jgi:hypothetical protein